MSLPLFLVKRVKHLQPAYFTHVPVQVKAALPEVTRSCCSVRTQLLSITKGTSSYWIFQPTANSFQIRMGLHFHIITFVTATHHIICGTGFFLLFIQATQILRKKNVILTTHHKTYTRSSLYFLFNEYQFLALQMSPKSNLLSPKPLSLLCYKISSTSFPLSLNSS